MASAAFAQEFWQFCAALGILLGPARHVRRLRADGRRHLALVHAAARARRRHRGDRHLLRRRAVAAHRPVLHRCAGLARDLRHRRHHHGGHDAAARHRALPQAGRAYRGADGARVDRHAQAARHRARQAAVPDLRGRARLLRGDGDAAGAHRRPHPPISATPPSGAPRCCR